MHFIHEHTRTNIFILCIHIHICKSSINEKNIDKALRQSASNLAWESLWGVQRWEAMQRSVSSVVALLLSFGRFGQGELLPDFPLVYVIYAPSGPLARAVVEASEKCPELRAYAGGEDYLKAAGSVRLRAAGDRDMPHHFPVKVCEVQLPRDVPSGALSFGRELPRITSEPVKTLLVGDTGLRVKTKNDGTCLHPGPKKLYGIKQCKPEDIIPFNASLVSGHFQNFSDWPLKSQMEAASLEKPDLVVHVGDYFYRQGPCPRNKPCTAINNDSFPLLPGAWGDNWKGWFADFFAPSISLLSQAPWIVLRGNHERCDRGGAGYFLFLDPKRYPDVRGGYFCSDYTEPYVVPFANEQFLIMDTAMVDDVDVDDVCPRESYQRKIFPSNRLEDPDQDTNRKEILEQVDLYRQQFDKIENMKLPNVTNFLLSHHPIFGIKCNKGRYESTEWTLQQALPTSTLDGISATIHGHVHWFQGLDIAGLPKHFIVGNGGTLLRDYSGGEDGATGMELVLLGKSVPIATAFSKSVFGYSSLVLQDGNYSFRANERGKKEIMWETSILPFEGRFLKESILVWWSWWRSTYSSGRPEHLHRQGDSLYSTVKHLTVLHAWPCTALQCNTFQIDRLLGRRRYQGAILIDTALEIKWCNMENWWNCY